MKIMNDWLKVDTHVHLHDCYDTGVFLDAAAYNLQVETGDDRIHSALCFTEVHGTNQFAVWADGFVDVRERGWSISPTRESNSLIATNSDGRTMALIAGRQIECQEGIEVLALGQRMEGADAEPVRDVLRAVVAGGAIAVLPWGFMKWSGRRGKLIDDLIRESHKDLVFGDNGARLAGSPEPRHLRHARSKGYPVLPGTDPFPFHWDAGRVGSYGMTCRGSLSQDTPFADFKAIVLKAGFSARAFGRRLGLLPFMRNQLAIQLRKRLKSWPQ